MIRPSQQAPLDIPCADESGSIFTLRELLGAWVVVYFYPKDNTPECTLEAEGFRDHVKDFETLSARVLGVSKDTCTSHQKFIAKKKLTFTLVADVDHVLMEAFGTWGERKFMGRTYMGTSRSTFLIDPHGTLVQVWEQVVPVGHPEEVLATLKGLQR